MPPDRANTEEQLRSDLRIRQDVPRETGDPFLLRCQLAEGLDAVLAQLPSGCDELTAYAFGERCRRRVNHFQAPLPGGRSSSWTRAPEPAALLVLRAITGGPPMVG
jgi:hypothetical protein